MDISLEPVAILIEWVDKAALTEGESQRQSDDLDSELAMGVAKAEAAKTESPAPESQETAAPATPVASEAPSEAATGGDDLPF